MATAAPLTSAPKQRVVSVNKTGEVQLDGNKVSLAELTTSLGAAQREFSQLSVVIRGDADCAFQHVASALAACKEANIAELGITVRLAQGDTKASR